MLFLRLTYFLQNPDFRFNGGFVIYIRRQEKEET